MQRKQIIKLAEEAGLLFNKDVAPYDTPAQQRLISKLEKFARSILEEENSLKSPEQGFGIISWHPKRI